MHLAKTYSIEPAAAASTACTPTGRLLHVEPLVDSETLSRLPDDHRCRTPIPRKRTASPHFDHTMTLLQRRHDGWQSTFESVKQNLFSTVAKPNPHECAGS